MDTLRPIQNTKGGFGGGQGQYSHLATTYASVLGIAVVGGEETYDLLDREAMFVICTSAANTPRSKAILTYVLDGTG